MLGLEEKRALLTVARDAIAGALRGNVAGSVEVPFPALSQPGGAFVTIRIHHQLRGCIGYIESHEPIIAVVAEVAAKAALDDPRFPALTIAELDQASLEISILSPLRSVTSIEEIEVGVHGLLIELGYARGLLLPQVAIEYRWTREAFLENTARKAGLSRTAWQDPDARIFTFTAEVFGEEDVGGIP